MDSDLEVLFERGDVLMKADEAELALDHYREAYQLGIRRLAASTPQTKAAVRTELLGCQDRLLACCERLGELGAALFASKAAIELAAELGHSAAEIASRYAHAEQLKDRVDALMRS